MDNKKKAIFEKIAEVQHDAWVEWSKAVAPDIKSPERVERWKSYWVPYEQLDEKTKAMDREWAEKVMEVIEPYLGAQPVKEVVMKFDPSSYPSLAKILGRGK
jgi:hypothetical protein